MEVNLTDILRHHYEANGLTIRAVAASYGISVGTVHRRLAAAGVPRRRAGRPDALSPANCQRVLALRKKGHSITLIAGTIGVSHNVVWKFLKAKGLPMLKFRRAA